MDCDVTMINTYTFLCSMCHRYTCHQTGEIKYIDHHFICQLHYKNICYYRHELQHNVTNYLAIVEIFHSIIYFYSEYKKVCVLIILTSQTMLELLNKHPFANGTVLNPKILIFLMSPILRRFMALLILDHPHI